MSAIIISRKVIVNKLILIFNASTKLPEIFLRLQNSSILRIQEIWDKTKSVISKLIQRE
jgi:hypothetical protein